MTNAETLLSLAERVEAASTYETASLLIEAFDLTNWRSKRRGSLVTHNPQWFAFDKLICHRGFIDAAMSLVPEGHHWQVGVGVETEFGNRNGAYAWCSKADSGKLSFAATTALALLAAALRAHASQSREPSK